MKIIEWVKTHKLILVLVVVIGFILIKQSPTYNLSTAPGSAVYESRTSKSMQVAPMGIGGADMAINNPAPVVSSERKVIENSYLSLLVKDVVDVRNKIVSYAQSNGGYMVNSEISNPQNAPQATVVVRVPSKNLESTLDYFRKLSVKVVTENLEGYDVTDQFTDIEKNISLYEKSKTKFEELLSRAQEISDITNLTQQIINYQSQIDSLKGQQDYLDKNAQLAKITLYISTDEIALPYAPNETFRPSVIFKLAVRSLVGTLRGVATALIWIIVYAVVIIPLILLAKFVYRRWLRKSV